MSQQNKFHIGQKVKMIGKDINWPRVVTDIMQSVSTSYPVIVEVKTGAGLSSLSFTSDGKFDKADNNPSLLIDSEVQSVSL